MTLGKLTPGLAATALLLAPAGAVAAHHGHSAVAAVIDAQALAASRTASADSGTPAGLPDNGAQLVGGVLAMLGGTGVIGLGLLARRR